MDSTFSQSSSSSSTTNLHRIEPKEKSDDVIISTLPKEEGWGSEHVILYQGFWCPDFMLPGVISLQKYFNPTPNHVLLTSYPKSGTTWLKALTFAITHQDLYSCSSSFSSSNDVEPHPLLTKNPHDFVPLLELYANISQENPTPDQPILTTHIPYASLPKQVIDSGCKIVYIARNPNDVLISFWHFSLKRRSEKRASFPLEVAYEMFCKGVSPYGSYWDHVLGYWNASLKFPERVLFLSYDKLKENPTEHVKRLAEFLGHPFSPEQEKQGTRDNIISLCSFENLSSLEVNKTGAHNKGVMSVRNEAYFRKGEVGDWKNYLSTEMAEHLYNVVAEKFKGSGLTPYLPS